MAGLEKTDKVLKIINAFDKLLVANTMMQRYNSGFVNDNWETTFKEWTSAKDEILDTVRELLVEEAK